MTAETLLTAIQRLHDITGQSAWNFLRKGGLTLLKQALVATDNRDSLINAVTDRLP